MLFSMKITHIDETQDLPVMISDGAWHSIHPFLKTLPNVSVGNPKACRRFLSAVVWITKQGATWRALPKVYGYWNTIYKLSGDGAMPGSLKNSMNTSMLRVKSLCSSLTQRSCGRIHLRRVPRKKTQDKPLKHSVAATAALRRNSMPL